MSNKPTESVITYADGRGRWYARVDFHGGIGPQELSREIDRIRGKARRHIRREILARASGPISPIRVEVTEDHWRHGQSPDHMNVWRSITYCERW